MSDQLSKVFGIDLGTTYSCISYVDEHGKPVIVPNFENNRVTPSVVFFDEDQIIVGQEAKNSLTVYPDQVVSFVKRDMGNENFLFEYNGETYKPEEISSYILKKLVQDASQNLGEEIREVVITCPAYFGINEREATRKAGEIAGLNVKAIINEPTAAAIAYGLEKGGDKVVLVYDLGGGTFDVTMIEITANSIQVIVTGGDHNLGGKNWDDEIIKYLASCFNEETGLDEDILEDPETRGELQLRAESAKKTLTQRPKANLAVNHDGEKVKVELTREKFEDLTKEHLERTIELTRDMLEEAKKKGYEGFDEIILVGGSTRMPQIKSRIDENFNTDAKSFDPDEAVAKGAAMFGWNTSISDRLIEEIAANTGKKAEEINLSEVDDGVKEKVEQKFADNTGLTLNDVKKAQKKIGTVASKSFGVIAFDENDVEKLFNLIIKNDRVPAEITQEFGTHQPNQSSIEIRIMESEVSDKKTEQEHGENIGTAVLTLPAGLPAGSPIKITFTINTEGRLDMRAVEETENRVIETSIDTKSVISDEELELAKQRSQSVKIM
jgi:molecular chaperone DnaK